MGFPRHPNSLYEYAEDHYGVKKYFCPCGGSHNPRWSHVKRHRNTKRHLKWWDSLSEVDKLTYNFLVTNLRDDSNRPLRVESLPDNRPA